MFYSSGSTDPTVSLCECWSPIKVQNLRACLRPTKSVLLFTEPKQKALESWLLRSIPTLEGAKWFLFFVPW